MANILVACIGNIFLGDDGFGVEVARRLAARPLPSGVEAVDFGIRSYDLAYAMMEDWQLVILVDAVPQGGPPGTLYVIEPDLAEFDSPEMPSTLDAHTMNPVAVLQLVKLLGGRPRRVLVVGCEPASVETDDSGTMELSAPVRAAVGEAVRIIERLCLEFRDSARAA